MKLDFDAHEKRKMKQTNRRLFIGNNNKDRKKKKNKSIYILQKNNYKEEISAHGFILNPYWQFHLH